MIIKNGTVLLRAIEEMDLPFLQKMLNDPEIEKLTGGGCSLFHWTGKRSGLNHTISKKS